MHYLSGLQEDWLKDAGAAFSAEVMVSMLFAVGGSKPCTLSRLLLGPKVAVAHSKC